MTTTTATLNHKAATVSSLIAAHPTRFVEMSRENPLVNAIRVVNGRKQIVEVRWESLSESEKSEAALNFENAMR